MANELETQTHETILSSTEVDELAITRKILGERQGHVRGIGRKVKGVGFSSSTVALQAPYGSGNIPCMPMLLRWLLGLKQSELMQG